MPVEVLPPPSPATRAQPDTALLWLEFRDRLRAFAARRVSNGADVDDIVAWVFLKLHQSLGGIRSGERIHAWLYQTARRAIADYYRSKARRVELPSGVTRDLETLAPAPSTEPEPSELQAAADCLTPMVRRLPAPYREALEATDLGGRRIAAAAAEAGLSVSGMKSRVQRARQRLRALLVECCPLLRPSGGSNLAVTAFVGRSRCFTRPSPTRVTRSRTWWPKATASSRASLPEGRTRASSSASLRRGKS